MIGDESLSAQLISLGNSISKLLTKYSKLIKLSISLFLISLSLSLVQFIELFKRLFSNTGHLWTCLSEPANHLL